jgi:hypothetical protein
MMHWTRIALFGAGLLLATAPLAWSQSQPADQGAGATAAITATCKDGTSWSGPSKKGACRGHKGVKSYTTASTAAPAAAAAAKPGGGKGQVWVNTETKVFHCQGSRYYGKTKKGEFMPEQTAIADGYHKAKNETCS